MQSRPVHRTGLDRAPLAVALSPRTRCESIGVPGLTCGNAEVCGWLL